MSTAKAHRRSGGRERGMALVLTLFAIATLLMVAAAGMNIGSANVQQTRNYRGATRVHMVAEAGISQALQIINGPGVIHMQNDVVGPWSGIYGTGNRGFAPHSGFSYYVSPYSNAANPKNLGRLVGKAYGKEGEYNVVVASVIRSDVPTTAPGAIYLAADVTTNSTFVGNAFVVDGNDHNYTGGWGPNPPIPGISTRNDTNTQEAIGSLNAAQKDNVTGLNYSNGPPIVPSINTSPAAPTAAQLSQMIDDVLATPPPTKVTWPGNTVNGMVVFGTTAAPQITYFPDVNGTEIKGNGNASGAGIMVVEGDLT